MSEFAFDLATAADDAALRRLLRENPVSGAVTIGYEREPSYFLGCPVMGPLCQTLVARHRPSGAVAGLASRAVRPLFVNGRVQAVGYLGQLRVDRAFRARMLVAGGFRLLRRLHREDPVGGYITTLVEGNREAHGVLVQRPRPGFPVYRPLDRLYTLALRPRPARRRPVGPLTVRAAGAGDRETLVAFLRRHGAGRQFFPPIEAADLLPDSPATRDLAIDDFLLAEEGGELRGTVALWDQSGYKQAVVRGYAGPLRWGRHLYNALACCRGWQPLPASGAQLRFACAAFTCVAGDDPDVYRRLLEELGARAACRGYSRLLVGLCGRDPLLAVARRFPHLPYASTLYSVCWPEESDFHDQFDDRICHLEIATL